MKGKRDLVLRVAIGLLVIAVPMSAHHSGANYDREHLITLSGTVTEYKFTNPHVQIHFDVKDEQGNIGKWVAVGDPPQRLFKLGWTKTTLKPGDKIKFTARPFKNGDPGGLFVNVTLADGRTLGQNAPRGNAPAGGAAPAAPPAEQK